MSTSEPSARPRPDATGFSTRAIRTAPRAAATLDGRPVPALGAV